MNKVALENPDIAALLVKASDAKVEFSDVELEQAYSYLYALLNLWTSIEHAYTRGLVTETTMDIALSDIQALSIDYPALRPLIKDMVETFPHAPSETRIHEAMQKAVARGGIEPPRRTFSIRLRSSVGCPIDLHTFIETGYRLMHLTLVF